ncbi:DUF4253 domain-containing protein [Salinibacterium sp. dk2585]|nr:DUF4253 domain-containing protein [Salinibacterium sp. dk2585]
MFLPHLGELRGHPVCRIAGPQRTSGAFEQEPTSPAVDAGPRHDEDVDHPQAWAIAGWGEAQLAEFSDGPSWLELVKQYPHSGLWPVCSIDPQYLTRPWERGWWRENGEGQSIRQVFGLERHAWSIQEDDYCFECGVVDDRSGELHIESRSSDMQLIDRVAGHPRDFWSPAPVAQDIALVPASTPAEAVAELGWSGPCNRRWLGADVVPVLQSWQERFGAYVYSASMSRLTLMVARPPRDEAEARLVAREHFHFCRYDTQFHGFEGIAPYVRRLVGSHMWSFWWD